MVKLSFKYNLFFMHIDRKDIKVLQIICLVCLSLFFYQQVLALTATSTPALPTVSETESAVRAYFADVPAMIAIAKCESGFRQYTNSGTPLRGSNLYIGVFQIDEKIHAKKALDLGFDIYTLDGNLAYAKYLYSQAGTKPWSGCVKNPVAVSLTLNLKLGMNNKQVLALQQVLNNAGYVIAKSGPGSVGNETNYFGSLTREALRRFQCDKGIVCTGSESSTGYGLVGPKTRLALLKAI